MIQLLITSSVLILVIALFRLLFRKKVSQRLIYALWLLAALRLLIPFEIGQSNYSLATVTKPAAQQVQQAVTRPIAGPSSDVVYDRLLQDYIAARPQPEGSAPVTPEVQTQLRQEASKQTAPSLLEILKIIWLSGIGLMMLWFSVTNLVFYCKARKHSVPYACNSRIPVRICPHIPAPCLVGLFRPVICIPPDESRSDEAVSHILAHETAHYRHWDPLWSLVRCACLCIYWFNPLVWMAAVLSRQDCELACDEAALKNLGDEARISYGKTLLSVVTYARSASHIMDMATSMGASKNQLKERMCLIVKKPKTILTAAVALLLISVLVAGCTFVGDAPSTGSVPSPGTSSSTEPTPSSSVNTGSDFQPLPTDPLVRDEYSDKLIQDMQIAADLIDRYARYRNYKMCCDYEYVFEDMSAYINEFQMTAQGEPYCGSQIKITCCHTLEEVEAHIKRTLSDNLATETMNEDLFFSDNEGNLYIAVTPMCGVYSYSSVRFRQTNGTRLVVYADTYDFYKITINAFKLDYIDGQWYLIDRFELPPVEERLPDDWITPA